MPAAADNKMKETPSAAELMSAVEALTRANRDQQSHINELKTQLDWFKKQLFGQKSEKRPLEPNPYQMALGDEFGDNTADQAEQPTKTITYQRGVGKKQRGDDCVTDSGLRFTDDVPVETIVLDPLFPEGVTEDDLELIDTRVTHRLAQRPASYVVLRYEQPIYKRRDTGEINQAPIVSNVLDKSLADVSLLAGLLVDKFQFHLPLYRQHQRMEQAGITVARSTLTQLVQRTIALLEPIVDAQLEQVLRSRVLAMDETPIKAGKSKTKKGRMHQGYFWPLYGEQHEVVFHYADTRARRVVDGLLEEQFEGVLLADGYSAYAQYAERHSGVQLAQCWSHTRRKFIDAEKSEPEAVTAALDMIRALYQHEKTITEQQLEGEKKRQYRLEHSKPIVDAVLAWAREKQQDMALLPKSPFARALTYLLDRAIPLRVFLEDPDVPLDTNHVERVIRPIPLGRKNWNFCWTELGARQVGIIQSLISTCKLQGVDPYVYLVDVLQRVAQHPASKAVELTPREWKTHFADNPLKSDLDRAVQYGSE